MTRGVSLLAVATVAGVERQGHQMCPSRRPWNAILIPIRVRERAHSKWVPDGECWISSYSVASHGYAQIGWQNKDERHVVLAHRASWELLNGPVPVGHTLDHLCKNRTCVNPVHLRVLTNFENARRTGGLDWPLGVCANGHPDRFLVEDPHRRDKMGNQRIGHRCSKCVSLSRARYLWRKRNSGKPMPFDLLLAREKPQRNGSASRILT
ncbi:HNH endonuclease signature motif containing protein [Galactobacter caseinivorans]|uniref:HNH endonuclease n=1 Tax=Galactobacter caseinivorans TaxID=2676123 RepID=A0A496PML6_9MICC|nr:HNH endonuclease [Galactobacter caseinivorans]